MSLNSNNSYRVLDGYDGYKFNYLELPMDETQIENSRMLIPQLRSNSWDLAKMLTYSPTSDCAIYINKLVSEQDLIVLAHPWMYPYVKSANAPIIYDAHNNEADAFAAYYSAESIDAEIALYAENAALQVSSGITACSSNDLIDLLDRALNKSIKHRVVPNGALESSISLNDNSDSRSLVFIGSGHFPNVEAAKRLCDIASNIPNFEFHIVGTAGLALDKSLVPRNITIHGYLEDFELDTLLSSSMALINPMLSGSGTHLKVARAMAAGLPIISTLVGSRGIENAESNGFCICENLNDFRIGIEKLGNSEYWQRKHLQSLEFSKSNSWNEIGLDFEEFLISNKREQTPNLQFASTNSEVDEEFIFNNSKIRETIKFFWKRLPLPIRNYFWLKIYPSLQSYRHKTLSIDSAFSKFKENVTP